MRIITSFPGANIHILSIDGNTVYLAPDMRDTAVDWFYWCFAVEDADGKTITFVFDNRVRVGYYGAAVSHDFYTWHWQNEAEGEPDRFVYTFSEDEGRVYFAHDMLYRPERMIMLAETLGLRSNLLCKSRKGRDIPYFTFGTGDRMVILTSRHHACESTGSYVLEGTLSALRENPIEGVKIFCVPMVDYDGVVDGDQGKGRAPHDHNRDYLIGEPSHYTEVNEIKKYIDTQNVVLGIDFHSPYHSGEYGKEHDTVYICRNDIGKFDLVARFSEILESEICPGSLIYSSENDVSVRTHVWMKDDVPTFARYVSLSRDEAVGMALETTYFGRADDRFDPGKAIMLGRCVAEAIRKYLNF